MEHKVCHNILIYNPQIQTICINHMWSHEYVLHIYIIKGKKPYRISTEVSFYQCFSADFKSITLFLILDCTYALHQLLRNTPFKFEDQKTSALQEMLISYLDTESNWVETMLAAYKTGAFLNWHQIQVTIKQLLRKVISNRELNCGMTSDMY